VTLRFQGNKAAKLQLIGGFIMLRFFTPALSTPEAFNILDVDCVPSKLARR